MTHGSGVQAYTRAQVSTATSQQQLIVMAYDGILKFLARAKDHIAVQEIEPAHNALVRARAVVEELAGTLNAAEGGLIARNLWNLYVFFIQKITEANLTKDPAHIDAIVPSLKSLREGWASMEIRDDDAKAQALNQRVPTADESHRLSIAG